MKQYEMKSGIWFLDLRVPYNAPKALHGWMSPEGMMELLEKDIELRNCYISSGNTSSGRPLT